MTELEALALRVYHSSIKMKEIYTEKQFIEAFKNGTLNKIQTVWPTFKERSNTRPNNRKRGEKKCYKSKKSKKSGKTNTNK